MRFLSYEVTAETPTYRDNPPVQLEQLSSIADGDIANWFSLQTINHNGTHVDAPWHFDPDGIRLDQLAPRSFFFTAARVIDIPKDADELITADDLRSSDDAIDGADLLLVRTGFGSSRRNGPSRDYGTRGPGFAEPAGAYLRRFRSLRAVGMDIISAGAPAHPGDGKAFHQMALGATSPPDAANPFVLLIEDCRLDHDLTDRDLSLVIMSPVIIKPSDGAPVTMLALSGADLADLGLQRSDRAMGSR
jgi:arylformamidase